MEEHRSALPRIVKTTRGSLDPPLDSRCLSLIASSRARTSAICSLRSHFHTVTHSRAGKNTFAMETRARNIWLGHPTLTASANQKKEEKKKKKKKKKKGKNPKNPKNPKTPKKALCVLKLVGELVGVRVLARERLELELGVEVPPQYLPPNHSIDLHFVLSPRNYGTFQVRLGRWRVPTHSSTCPVALQNTTDRTHPTPVSTTLKHHT